MISLILSISASVSSPALTKHINTWLHLPLVGVDLCDFQNKDGEPSADSSDDSDGEGDLLFTINVGVLHSLDECEIFFLLNQ